MKDIDVKDLPGLKEAELIRLGFCATCGKPLLDPGKSSLTFYCITISRAALLPDAIMRRHGLQTMLGGSVALAQAMGPDDNLAKVFDGPKEVMVHEACADVGHLLALMEQ